MDVGMGNDIEKQNQQDEFYTRKRKTLNSKACMLLYSLFCISGHGCMGGGMGNGIENQNQLDEF